LESPAIHALCRRLAAASGTDVGQGEPLQVLCYSAGQEYKPHFDAIDGTDNQRILTFLVYLNDDFDGGETEFLSTGLKVKGRKGDALLFRNADDLGRPDLKSQHAGLPPTTGVKFLASRWIRQKPVLVSHS
jgi:prolyl 4-hydroxylase